MKAQTVKLRFFGGLKNTEIAALLEINEKTVRRHWSLDKVTIPGSQRRNLIVMKTLIIFAFCIFLIVSIAGDEDPQIQFDPTLGDFTFVGSYSWSRLRITTALSMVSGLTEDAFRGSTRCNFDRISAPCKTRPNTVCLPSR